MIICPYDFLFGNFKFSFFLLRSHAKSSRLQATSQYYWCNLSIFLSIQITSLRFCASALGSSDYSVHWPTRQHAYFMLIEYERLQCLMNRGRHWLNGWLIRWVWSSTNEGKAYILALDKSVSSLGRVLFYIAVCCGGKFGIVFIYRSSC